MEFWDSEDSGRQVVFLSQRREEPHNTEIQEHQTTPEMRLEMERTGSWWWSRAEIFGVDFRIRLIDRRPLALLKNHDESIELIYAAMKIAKEEGATDIGLGSLVASVSRGGSELLQYANFLQLRLDHGDDMSTGLAAQAAWRLRDLGLDLRNSTIGIVGAVGLMGAGFAKLLSLSASKFVLVVRQRDERVQQLVSCLTEINPNRVVVTSDFADLQHYGCDLVYVAHSAPDLFLRPENLKPKTIVLDACIPPAVRAEEFAQSTHLVIPVGCGTLLHLGLLQEGVGVDLGLGPVHMNVDGARMSGSITYGCMLGCILAARLGDKQHRISEVDPGYASFLLDEGKKRSIIHQPFPVSDEQVKQFLRNRS